MGQVGLTLGSVSLHQMKTRKKSEPQMGVEPTTLSDLVRCSNHRATGDLMVRKGARFYDKRIQLALLSK